ASEKAVELLLPVDVVVADEIDENSDVETVSIDNIPSGKRIVDIGLRTVANFADQLKNCRTVFWNGTMGISEIPAFAAGTRAVAEILSGLDAVTVLGGGSTSEAATNMGLAEKMTFISTGGGASLKFLGGQKLPGVEALLDKKS
ncbi:phosphoglycerate kinase, partial [Chloroflexota bacterium]